MFKQHLTPMKHTKYRVMEITDGYDNRFGKIWIIKANPAVVNEFSGTTSIMSDIYEDTETFFVPYDMEFVVKEIEDVAKKGQLWTPDKDEWRGELAFDEDKKKQSIINRWCLEEPRIVITEQKPLRQYLLERNEDIHIFQDINKGNMLFLCGKVKGMVGSSAAKHIADFGCSIDKFTFEMVTKNDLPPVPYITLSRPKTEESIQKDTFH